MLFSCLLGHLVYKIQNFLDTIKFSNFIINCSFSKPRFVFVSSTIRVFSELILPEIISFIYVVTSRKLPNKCRLSSSLNSRNFAKDLFNLQFTTYISKNGFFKQFSCELQNTLKKDEEFTCFLVLTVYKIEQQKDDMFIMVSQMSSVVRRVSL